MTLGHIRPIDLSDTAEMLKLLSLQMAAYMKEAEMIGLPDIPPFLESPDSIRSSEESFAGYFEEEELLGAVSVKQTPESVTVCRLMVRPDRFRQGIGARLLEVVLNGTGASTRTKSVKVRSMSSNAPALALYRRFGFRKTSEYRLDNGLVLLELELPPAGSVTPKRSNRL